MEKRYIISGGGTGGHIFPALAIANKIKAENPDVCFLDIVMPVMDGVSAVKEIIGANKQALIIIVSSVGTQSMLKAAIDAGAKDFIQKPIEKEQVEHVLDAHLGG